MSENNTWFIDTTLRDGEQAPGVVFSLDEKIAIAEILNDFGIHEMELGTPSISKNDIACIKLIKERNFSFRSSVWARATTNDIVDSARTGVEAINISFPVSVIQLNAIGKDYSWVLRELKQKVLFAKNIFQYVSVGAQDASRCDPFFLNEFVGLSGELKVDRIRIADTVGILEPLKTHQMIRDILLNFPDVNIDFHGHNDLGMATANTLTAILAGAKSVSTTINGLGERAGNTPLDEIVMSLKHACNFKIPFNTGLLTKMSVMVENASGRKNSISKPVTGKVVFKHESGIHVNSILKNKRTYQIISNHETGNPEHGFVIGKHSGKSAVQNVFQKNNIMVNSPLLDGLVDQVKLLSRLKKEEINESELMELFYKLS